MNMWSFIGEHPFLTVIILTIVLKGIHDIILAIRRPVDSLTDDD